MTNRKLEIFALSMFIGGFTAGGYMANHPDRLTNWQAWLALIFVVGAMLALGYVEKQERFTKRAGIVATLLCIIPLLLGIALLLNNIVAVVTITIGLAGLCAMLYGGRTFVNSQPEEIKYIDTNVDDLLSR